MAKRADYRQRIERALQNDGARAPHARWFAENHDWFAQKLKQYGANWQRIAREFQELGLVGPDIKPGTLKRAWHRVHRCEMQRRSAQPTQQVTESKPVVLPQPADQVRQQDVNPTDDEDELEFRPFRLNKHYE